MRVVHEKLAKQSGQAGERARRAFEASCDAALQGGKGGYENPLSTGAELRPLLAKAHDDLNPLRIRSLLRAIPDSELQLLDMSAVDGRPENLLIVNLTLPLPLTLTLPLPLTLTRREARRLPRGDHGRGRGGGWHGR